MQESRSKVPQSKRSGSSVDILFSCPHCPCTPASRLNLQGKSCLPSRESVLECFNGLGHHRGNFCEENGASRFRWVAAQTHATMVYSKARLSLLSLAVYLTSHTNGLTSRNWLKELPENPIVRQTLTDPIGAERPASLTAQLLKTGCCAHGRLNRQIDLGTIMPTI